jgi:predicted nucleic acid-binding protein
MGQRFGGINLNQIILDTFPILKFFKNEKGAEEVEKILNKIERKEIKGFISSITISELFYILSRFKSEKFAKGVINHIRISNLKIISLDYKIAEIGGKFKFKYSGKGKKKGLPMADAIIAATSYVNDLVLICDEEDYFKIKEIKVKKPKEFLSK